MRVYVYMYIHTQGRATGAEIKLEKAKARNRTLQDEVTLLRHMLEGGHPSTGMSYVY